MYNDILNIIKESYDNDCFDKNIFEFYKGRKNKSKYRAGIINYKKKYFFKILSKEEYNDESNIDNMINPFFKTVKKLEKLETNNYIISLYEYIDAPKLNAFNYLRNDHINYKEKQEKINTYFTNLKAFQEKYITVDINKNTKKSDRWFYNRYKLGRLEDFYGINNEKLLNELKNISVDMYYNYVKFFHEVDYYLKEKTYTIFTYSHGDFHDFNFTLDGLYWDNDTFDYNPILNDFVIYYWHFYAREDYLIYFYSPWLIEYMYNGLNKEETIKIRNLKREQIVKWFHYLSTLFEKNNINLNNELKFKLFCRIFLIDDVTLYDKNIRENIYKYFNEIIISDNIYEALFNNRTVFDVMVK